MYIHTLALNGKQKQWKILAKSGIEKLWCRLASISGFVIRKNIKGKSKLYVHIINKLVATPNCK